MEVGDHAARGNVKCAENETSASWGRMGRRIPTPNPVRVLSSQMGSGAPTTTTVIAVTERLIIAFYMQFLAP